jgi:hypothetical protein
LIGAECGWYSCTRVHLVVMSEVCDDNDPEDRGMVIYIDLLLARCLYGDVTRCGLPVQLVILFLDILQLIILLSACKNLFHYNNLLNELSEVKLEFYSCCFCS